MARSLFLSYSGLSVLFGALSLLICGVNAKVIPSVTPTAIMLNETTNDTEPAAEPMSSPAADISHSQDLLVNQTTLPTQSADRSKGESKNLDTTTSLVLTTETAPIQSKLSSSNTRAPVAVTRDLKGFRLSSVTKINKSGHASLDDPINVSVLASAMDGANSKSYATLADSRRDLQDMDGIIQTLEDIQSKVNSTLGGICSTLRPGEHIPPGFTCMTWAESRGRDSLPCNDSLTPTVPSDADKRTTVVNSIVVLRELERLLRAVVLQYYLLPGNTSRCTDFQPSSNHAFRCSVASAKRNIQNAITILLKGIDESEVLPENNLTCLPDQALGAKFPLGVLWRVNGKLNSVITNVRRVCTSIC